MSNNDDAEVVNNFINKLLKEIDDIPKHVIVEETKEFKRQLKLMVCAGACFVVLWVGVILWVVL